MFTSSLALVLIAAWTTTPQSHALESMSRTTARSQAISLISQNTQLRNNLREMGYTTEEAAEKFAELKEAQSSAESSADFSMGTLAICGKMALELGGGVSISKCTTLFNSYDITVKSISLVGVTLTLGGQAVYFRTGNRDITNTYCYKGGELGFAYQLGADLAGLKEIDCQKLAHESIGIDRDELQVLTAIPAVKNQDYGFAAQVSVVGGVNGNLLTGVNANYSFMKIEHTIHYWK